MKLLNLKLYNIEIHSIYNNGKSHMIKLFLDDNSNLIFKIYFFPKYKDEETEIYNQEFIIYQNKEIKYKFHGKNLSRQTSILYENKILKIFPMHIYNINLYKISSNDFCDVLNKCDEYSIEKNLIQTYKNISYIPKELLIYNKDINLGYNYYFFSDNAIRRFIKNNYKKDVLETYDMFIPGAFRADYFRLLVLYALGGAYIDHKVVLNKNFDEILHDKKDFFLVNDFDKNAIYNSFLVFKKGNLLLKKAMELLKKKILNKYFYNTIYHDSLQIGPRFFQRHFDFGDMYYNFYKITHGPDSMHYSKLVIDNNREIIYYTSYDNYFYVSNIENHYSYMFSRKLIVYNVIKKNKNYLFYLWNHFYSDQFEFEIKNNNLHVIRTDKQEGFAYNHTLKIVDTLFNKEKLIEIGPSEKPYKIITNVF